MTTENYGKCGYVITSEAWRQLWIIEEMACLLYSRVQKILECQHHVVL